MSLRLRTERLAEGARSARVHLEVLVLAPAPKHFAQVRSFQSSICVMRLTSMPCFLMSEMICCTKASYEAQLPPSPGKGKLGPCVASAPHRSEVMMTKEPLTACMRFQSSTTVMKRAS